MQGVRQRLAMIVHVVKRILVKQFSAGGGRWRSESETRRETETREARRRPRRRRGGSL